MLAWSRAANRSPASFYSKHYTGGSRLQEGTRSAKDELEKHSQEGSAKKWDSPARRLRWQLSTDQNGVGV